MRRLNALRGVAYATACVASFALALTPHSTVWRFSTSWVAHTWRNASPILMLLW
jgi:hypothetical protein